MVNYGSASAKGTGNATRILRLRKDAAAKVLGGKCAACGQPYTEETRHRFDFHHVIATGETSKRGAGPSHYLIERHTAEEHEENLQKCVLVCANCHQDIHNIPGLKFVRLAPGVIHTLFMAFFRPLIRK